MLLGDVDFFGFVIYVLIDCGDIVSYYDKIVGDEIILVFFGKVYNFLFGLLLNVFMSKWFMVE